MRQLFVLIVLQAKSQDKYDTHQRSLFHLVRLCIFLMPASDNAEAPRAQK